MCKQTTAKIISTGRSVSPENKNELAEVEPLYDRIGRQVMSPYHLRGSIATAYVALANGTETALLTGVVSEYHDLLSLIAANTSNAAITLTIKESTGGSTTLSVIVPANDTKIIHFPTPIPQAATNASWTIDMGDFTNTTVNIAALFVKNI